MTAHSERSFHASAIVGFVCSLNLADSFLDMYPAISEVGFHEVLINIEYITLGRCWSGVPLCGGTHLRIGAHLN